MKVHVLEVPLDYGGKRHGSDMGPSAIRLAGLRAKLEEIGHTVNKDQDVIKTIPQEYVEPGNNPKAKYLQPIVESCTEMAGRVEEILNNGEFPLMLGGDHSIVMGSLAGMHAWCKKQNLRLGVLYVDAHGDFNTTETTGSGNIHGQCLAASAGYGLPELCNIYEAERKVNPENICYVGCRDLDVGEVGERRGVVEVGGSIHRLAHQRTAHRVRNRGGLIKPKAAAKGKGTDRTCQGERQNFAFH